MFKIHLKTIIRNLFKSPVVSGIKIFGLTIGFACSIMVFIFVNYEYSFDKFNKDANRIYRVAISGILGETVIDQTYSCAPLPRALYAECSEVESVVRITTYGAKLKYGDKVFFESNDIMADSTLFDIFTFPFVEGNPQKSLTEPNTMVITESFAKKIFGNEDPMGKTIIHDDNLAFKVTGVIKDIPKNSHFTFHYVISLVTFRDFSQNDRWYNNSFRTYIRLAKGFDYKKTEAKFPGILEKYTGETDTYRNFTQGDNYWHFYLQPLTDIHLNSDLSGELQPNGNKKYVQIFILIGIFILLIACVNYMNLTTARASNRANEIGIKKVVGSSKRFLVIQFLTESVMFSVISLLFALVLVQILLPLFGHVLDRDLSFPLFNNPYLFPGLLGIAIFIGLFAGSYPAFILSRLKPVSILKGRNSSGAKSAVFRNALVILQFSISVILIAATILINKQLTFIKNDRLGFNKENVLIIENRYLLNTSDKIIREEISKIPNVKQVSLAHTIPGRDHNNWGMNAEGIDHIFTLNVCGCDCNFLDVLNLHMTKGRFFSDSIASDAQGIILNEAAANLFNWPDGPLGKRIDNQYRVIGVVEDYHYESMRQKIRPMALLYLRGVSGLNPNYILIKTDNKDVAGIIKGVEKFWNQNTDGSAMNYTFLDEDYDKLYHNEQQTSQLFLIFSILAILIACLGLVGLSTFMIEQRIKEIGVRKVNGARIIEVVQMLNIDFAIWVIIAYVISCPLAYWLISKWLNTFAYHTRITWWAFLTAGILAIFIAILTVSWQTLKAARRNPVEALRYE